MNAIDMNMVLNTCERCGRVKTELSKLITEKEQLTNELERDTVLREFVKITESLYQVHLILHN
jgi:hypothetical protein